MFLRPTFICLQPLSRRKPRNAQWTKMMELMRRRNSLPESTFWEQALASLSAIRAQGTLEADRDAVGLYLSVAASRSITKDAMLPNQVISSRQQQQQQQRSFITADSTAEALRLFKSVPENVRTQQMYRDAARTVANQQRQQKEPNTPLFSGVSSVSPSAKTSLQQQLLESSFSSSSSSSSLSSRTRRVLVLDSNILLLLLRMGHQQIGGKRSHLDRMTSISHETVFRTITGGGGASSCYSESKSKSKSFVVVVPWCVQRELIALTRRQLHGDVERNILMERFSDLAKKHKWVCLREMDEFEAVVSVSLRDGDVSLSASASFEDDEIAKCYSDSVAASQSRCGGSNHASTICTSSDRNDYVLMKSCKMIEQWLAGSEYVRSIVTLATLDKALVRKAKQFKIAIWP